MLVRRVRRNLTAQNPPDVDEEIICRGVSSFKLEYFDGSQWQTTWDSTENTDANNNNALPAAVRVTLEMEAPAGRWRRPNVQVHPRVPVVLLDSRARRNGGATNGSGLGL